MKKVVSLLLVLVLALGMSTVAFAAYTPKVTINANAGQEVSRNDSLVPGDSLTFDASGNNYFTEVPANASAGVTKKNLTGNKIVLKTRISKGSAAIDEVKLVYGTGDVLSQIKLVTVDPFVSNNTDGLDFEVTAYFTVDGKSFVDNGVVFSGNLCNRFSDEDVDKDTTYFDMSDGTIMKPSELVKNLEYDLGDEVSVFGRALKGVKYYGVATTDTTDADDAKIIEFNLDGVYHIKAIGLPTVANYVTLGGADATQYIYDGEMKYLGRGNDHLPYADTYFLSAKELDTDSETEEPTDEESSDEEPMAPNPGTGADDDYPTNVNDNPGTGR